MQRLQLFTEAPDINKHPAFKLEIVGGRGVGIRGTGAAQAHFTFAIETKHLIEELQSSMQCLRLWCKHYKPQKRCVNIFLRQEKDQFGLLSIMARSLVCFKSMD